MRFTLTLLFCTVGVLPAGGDQPDSGGEVQALRMELSAVRAELSSLQEEIVRLKNELDVCARGLSHSQSMEPSQRRGQEVVEEVAPLTIPAMWSHESGPCVVGEDGCWTSANFPAQHGAEGNCAVSVDPSWTGFLFAEYMRRTFGNEFYVDGEPGPASGGQLGVHGMSPRNTLRWLPQRSSGWTSGRWKICQVDALPLWTVTVGEHCSIDRLGCFETEALLNQRVLGNCFADSERCVVELSAEWEGSLDVVEAHFIDADDVNFTVVTELEVNGQTFPLSSVDDISRAGVQGMVAKNFTWTKTGWSCAGVKICPAKSTRLPGPWGDDPWTCTELGDSCTLPFELNGISFSACTQQLSDPDDADQDGSLHNGHPQCKSATGLSLCGPCSCGAGQEQTNNVSRVYPHTPAVELVACAPCEAGRFKSLGGSGAPASCEQCAPGTSSSSGATACSKCLPGLFSSHHESLECASCQPGYFGSGSGLTTCQLCDVATHTSTTQQTACLNCLPGMFKGHGMLQCDPCSPGYFGSGPGLTTCLQCAVGNYSSTEGWTACDSCPEGSVLKAQDSGCQECSPGTYRRSSMTSCSSCAAGRFQNTSGQTGCHQCSAVLDAQGPNPHLWTTMTRTENMEWQEIWGSQSERDCGCAAGAWIDALGQCQECGVGLSCRGMGELEVLPGYFTSADNAGFVWRCHGPDWARCPGGLPGTCAQGRRNSTTCEECEPYTRKTDDGPCKACTGPDLGLLVGACILVFGLLWIVYFLTVREHQTKKMESFAFASILGSQVVSLFQMLGVLKTLSVKWPAPVATIVEMGSLLNFKFEVFNLGCVVSTPPLYEYVANAFAVVVPTVCVTVCHYVHILVFHFSHFRRAQFRQFTPALIGAVGTVFGAVYISVCSAIVQPLQCEVHPNELSTMQAYREVVCWDPEGDHHRMMIVGALASLLPLVFLSLCAWVTHVLPKRLHQGDTAFLNAFAFLLFRFRPGAHNHALVLLLRNFALAVIPVIADLAIKLCASAVVVIACLLLGVSRSPWIVRHANHLDVAMHAGLLIVLFLAALQTTAVDDDVIGNLLLAVFSGFACAFLIAMVWSLHLCALRLRKPFQFFLCHHKVGGGAFCRLLKMRLMSHAQVSRNVFLDSDNLQDLSLLFAIVGEKTETLVVLCTKEILYRPWCVGEMTTARLHNIDTILVIFPDFEDPTRTFIENFASVEGVQSLAPYGISFEMAQQTLWWLGTLPWIGLPRSISSTGADAVVEKLVSRRKGTQEMTTVLSMTSTIRTPENEEHDVVVVGRWRVLPTVSHLVSEPVEWSSPAAVDVVSIVDHTNQESVCTALLVKELLKRFFPLTGPGHVLGPNESLPRSATLVLVMSSTDCFLRPSFVRQLFQAERLGVGAVPVIVDDRFQFPSDAFFEELRALSTHVLSAADTERGADDLISLTRKLFEEIAIHVRPQDSQRVLEVRAEAIAQRLSAPRKAIMCQGVPPTRTHSASAAAADAFELKVSDDGASSSEESVDNDALVDLMFEQELFHLEVASEGEIPLPP